MGSRTKSPGNREKLEQLREALAEMLAGVLKHGFHGTAGLELSVQDGTIQHIRRKIEQIERLEDKAES